MAYALDESASLAKTGRAIRLGSMVSPSRSLRSARPTKTRFSTSDAGTVRSLPPATGPSWPHEAVAFSRAHRHPRLRPRRHASRPPARRAGHSVAVVDQDPTSFRSSARSSPARPSPASDSTADPRDAGIARAHAFAAVSSGDNSNILAARVARETYGVEQVVARIYDPRRAEVYQRLGIPTVATVPGPRARSCGASSRWARRTSTATQRHRHPGRGAPRTGMARRRTSSWRCLRRPRRLHHPIRPACSRTPRPSCRRATSCMPSSRTSTASSRTGLRAGTRGD